MTLIDAYELAISMVVGLAFGPDCVKPETVIEWHRRHSARVLGEFLKSRGDRRLIQSATALLPSVRSKA
jgi:hypothetical protein